MMYYRISKNEKNLFFGKKIAQVWAVTLSLDDIWASAGDFGTYCIGEQQRPKFRPLALLHTSA